MTKFFFGFAKYFSGFKHNSWICKFVWDLQNNIRGFNTFIRICNSFSDLINSSTMISKKHYDFNFFFGFLKHFFRFRKYFRDCPLSASVDKSPRLHCCCDKALLLFGRCVACVAGARKGKGEKKSRFRVRPIFPSPFPFLARAVPKLLQFSQKVAPNFQKSCSKVAPKF